MTDITRAVCGLDCKTCPVYIVTHHPEGALTREEVAAQWSALYGRSIDPAELVCDGCRSDTLWAACAQCPLRDCAVDRKVEQCPDCPDFVCARLQQMYDFNTRNQTGIQPYAPRR